MTSPSAPAVDPSEVAVPDDGFEVLDACHRQTIIVLRQLGGLVAGLDGSALAAPQREALHDIVRFFSDTSRRHHEDEERHVFPKLLSGDDAALAKNVLRLQQDHHWLDADWRELAPQLDALAHGQSWVDLDVLREGVEVFSALSLEHVELEESCIYPQARARSAKSDRREMAREMAARRHTHRTTHDNPNGTTHRATHPAG